AFIKAGPTSAMIAKIHSPRLVLDCRAGSSLAEFNIPIIGVVLGTAAGTLTKMLYYVVSAVTVSSRRQNVDMVLIGGYRAYTAEPRPKIKKKKKVLNSMRVHGEDYDNIP
ncbi:hypothetical protein FOZ63_010857, partial [Perkinsus olseni]